MKTSDDVVEVGLALYAVKKHFDRKVKKQWGSNEPQKKHIEDLLYMLPSDAIFLLRDIIRVSPSFLIKYRFEDIFCFPIEQIDEVGKFKQSVREPRFSTPEEELDAKPRENTEEKRDQLRVMELRRGAFDKFVKERIVPKLELIRDAVGFPPAASVHTKNKEEKKKANGNAKRKPTKLKLVEIYANASPIYQQKRIEYGNRLGTGYGADKRALEKTITWIENKYHCTIRPRNLKEAMNRRIDRTPMKKGKE